MKDLAALTKRKRPKDQHEQKQEQLLLQSPGPPAVTTRHDVELAKLKDKKSARLLDYAYGSLRESIRASVWLGLFYFGYKTVTAFAGTSTNVNADLKAVLSVSADRWVAWVVALLTTGGYIHERRLRRKVIAELGSYPKELEQTVDQRRSSSRLLPSGVPRKEDRDAP